MANPLKVLNETFFYNSMLSRALIQLLPADSRFPIQEWIKKLHELEGGVREYAIRNEYMWFILLLLQNKKIISPFNEPPIYPFLIPLKDLLNKDVYEEVINAVNLNTSWLDHVEEEVEEKKVVKKLQSCKPSKFVQNQPIPKAGVICYIGAFSDQF